MLRSRTRMSNIGPSGLRNFHDLSYVYANGASSDLHDFRWFSVFVIRLEREAIFLVFLRF